VTSTHSSPTVSASIVSLGSVGLATITFDSCLTRLALLVAVASGGIVIYDRLLSPKAAPALRAAINKAMAAAAPYLHGLAGSMVIGGAYAAQAMLLGGRPLADAMHAAAPAAVLGGIAFMLRSPLGKAAGNVDSAATGSGTSSPKPLDPKL
jgi:acetyl-CoA carboxylase beta subunit